MPTLSRCVAAEAMGTAFLVATVVGSGIMAESLAGGNGALALLGNTVPTGAMLIVLITIFGDLSGAHLNPAVTAAVFVRGEISASVALAYVFAQVLGAVAGTVSAHLMFHEAVFQLSDKLRTGPSQWFSEFIATFGLLLTILGTLRHRHKAIAITVGAYIVAAYWFTASTSFANPAVTIARAFTNTFSGIAPAHAPAFIISQLAGAILATWFAGWLFDIPAVYAKPTKHQATLAAE